MADETQSKTKKGRSTVPRPSTEADLLELAQAAGGLGLFQWDLPARVTLSSWLLSTYELDTFDDRHETWLTCVYREDRIRVAAEFDEAFAAGAANVNVEFRIQGSKSNVLKWIEARSLIAYDADGKPVHVIGVHVDVTERKRSLAELHSFRETLEDRVRDRTRALEEAADARARAEDSVRQMQKIEAVGQLTGGIAHDFNNMLAVVIGALNLIERRLRKGEDISGLISGATDAARRAAELTQRLLAFSRQLPLEPRVVNVNRLVAEMSDLLTRTLGASVRIETVLAAGLWPTNTDPGQLQSALLNLAINARDAMEDDGKLTIETANAHLDDSYARKHADVRAGQYVMIAVSDAGSGMSPETLERAFDPFFTTKAVGKGTGLGLSQVFGYLKQSHGHIKIYSEIDQGTTVKIYLPRHYGDADASPDKVLEVSTPQGSATEVVLVVEDDDRMREIASASLSELGYTVLLAPSGASALSILRSGRKIDLLFTDIVMPDMNGRRLADEALLLRPDLKVLFTTGYSRNAVVHNGVLDSGVHLLAKPYSLADLGRKVREVLTQATAERP